MLGKENETKVTGFHSFISMDLNMAEPVEANQEFLASIPDGFNLDRLPAPIRNFIRLQYEISGVDVGENGFALNPPILTSLTQENSKAAQNEKRKKRKKQYWDEHLLFLAQLYNKIYASVWHNLEVKLEVLDVLEHNLSHLDKFGFKGDTTIIEDRIDSYRTKLLEQQEILKSSPPPSRGALKSVNQTIDTDMEQLAKSFTGFMDAQIKALFNLKDSKAAKFKEALEINAPKASAPIPFGKASRPSMPNIYVPDWDALEKMHKNSPNKAGGTSPHHSADTSDDSAQEDLSPATA